MPPHKHPVVLNISPTCSSVVDVHDRIRLLINDLKLASVEYDPSPTANAFLEIGSVAVPALIQAMSSSNLSACFNAARCLERMGKSANAAVPTLIDKALESSNSEMRCRAARALANIAEANVKDIPTLLNTFGCSNAKDSRNARVSLLSIGKLARIIAAAMTKALTDCSSEVRFAAATALIKLGYPFADDVRLGRIRLEREDKVPQMLEDVFVSICDTVRDLIVALRGDIDMLVRHQAASALGNIGQLAQRGWPARVEAERALAVLTQSLGDKERIVRWAVAGSLGKFGALAKEAVPRLLESLKDPAVSIGSEAISALGKIGEPPADVVPVLIRAIRGDDKDMRFAGVRALGRFGELGCEAFPDLCDALWDKDLMTRRAAVLSLGDAINVAGEAVAGNVAPALIGFLGDSEEALKMSEWSRSDVIRYLGKCGEFARDAVPLLIKITKGDDCAEKWHAANALGELRLLPDKVVPALVDAVKNSERSCQSTAIAALGAFGELARDAVPILLEVLSDGDGEIRRCACDALGRIYNATVRVAAAAAAKTDALRNAIVPALVDRRENDALVLVQMQADRILEAMGEGFGPVSFEVMGQPPVGMVRSKRVIAMLNRANKQLLTFCLVGEVCVRHHIDSFTCRVMLRLLHDEYSFDVPDTTLREHLNKAKKIFAVHFPAFGPLFEGGKGQRGLRLSPGWQELWSIAMEVIGRKLPEKTPSLKMLTDRIKE